MNNRTVNPNDEAPELSIVVPAFCESGNLQRLHQELTQVLDEMTISYEVVFVDDGSMDDTWSEIVALHGKDPRMKGVRLSRNFGHQYALFAGMVISRGNAVITMDADLQHPPSVIPDLVKEWRAGMKIVHTVRNDHQEISWLKKKTSEWFYQIFSFLSGVSLEKGMSDFRLFDRQVIEEFRRLKEGGLFLRGLTQWVGYPSARVQFQCRDRFAGVSKYSIGRMFNFAWSGLTSFSVTPLRLSILIGCFTSLLAFYQLGEALWAKFITQTAIPGWASIIGLQSLLFGVLFILLGIIGEYIARILDEVRQRPRFIVNEVIGFPTCDSEGRPFTMFADLRTGSH